MLYAILSVGVIMKRLFISTIISCLFVLTYSFAQEMRIVGGETHSTMGEISSVTNAKSPEASKETIDKRKTWLDKYTKILRLADASRVKDSILWVKAAKNLSENLKNFRIEQLKKRATEQIQADKIDQTIRAYGETYVPHKVKFSSGDVYTTWIRYFDGRVSAILGDPFNTGRKTSFAHFLIDNTVGDDVVGTASPTTNFTDYIRLLYEDNLIDYQKVSDGIYIDDKLNEYDETLITVGKEGLENPLAGQEDVTVDEVDSAHDKLKDTIVPDIEDTDTLKTEKEHTNIIRYDTEDAIDGAVKSEDVTIKTNDAPDAPETQHVGYEYTEKDKPEGASEVIPDEIEFPHHEQGFKENEEKEVRTKEAVINKSVVTSTLLGLVTVIETSVSGLNSFNEATGFSETRKTESGDLIREDIYSAIEYNNSGDITSYNLESTTPNGIKKAIEARNIEYDSLKRVTKKDETVKIDSSTWTYNYTDFAYNNLWQITGFNVKITDPNGSVTNRVQSGMLYDGRGLLTNVTRVDVTGTEIETTLITYNYNDNGLLSEIIHQVTIENGTAKESHYKWWGNFTYNAGRQITRYNFVDIKRTGVLEFLDFKSKITDLLNSISDTYPFTTTTLNLASLGFTSSDTVIIQKWRNISFASHSQTDILTSAQIEDELQRLSAFNSITRTTTLTTDIITTSNKTTL